MSATISGMNLRGRLIWLAVVAVIAVVVVSYSSRGDHERRQTVAAGFGYKSAWLAFRAE